MITFALPADNANTTVGNGTQSLERYELCKSDAEIDMLIETYGLI